MIAPEAVQKAVQKMENNKIPGQHNITVELIKQTLGGAHHEIIKTLNKIFVKNSNEIELGTGILSPLPQSKQTYVPVKNFRPITTLENILKNLDEQDRFQDQKLTVQRTKHAQKEQKNDRYSRHNHIYNRQRHVQRI